MVSTRRPAHCTASVRQPRTVTPSSPHRAGAAYVLLAAHMAAGEAELVAQEIDQVRASTVSRTASSFTVSVMARE